MKKEQVLENKKKLIVIKTKENKIELYEDKKLIKSLDEVYVGKNGLTDKKEEGDNCTPKGLYNLGFAFGTLENTFTYPYYKIKENQYWVSDSNSKYYNEWVEITENKKDYPYSYMNSVDKISWTDAEHLIDYPVQYELALVIEYNIKPKVPNKGSAIFFHVNKSNVTAGCVATSLNNLLYIVNWLRNDKAQIFISD